VFENIKSTVKYITRFSFSSVMWLPLTTVGVASNFRLYREKIIREITQRVHMQCMLHSLSWIRFKVDLTSVLYLQALQILHVCTSCLQELVIHCQNLHSRLLLQKQYNNTLPSSNFAAKFASEVLSASLEKSVRAVLVGDGVCLCFVSFLFSSFSFFKTEFCS